MHTLTALLVDDERLARENLRRLLGAHPEVRILGEARNIRQAQELTEAQKPELLFLDIQMPGGSGFELLERLDDPPRILFVTAYDQYAIRAFEVNAVDYLLKPIEPDRLAGAVARVMALPVLGGSPAGVFRYDDSVLLHSGRQSFFIPLADIAVIQADGNYTHVMTVRGDSRTVRRSLKEWQALLPADSFVLLDRSNLINRHQLRRWQSREREAEIWFGESKHPLLLGRAGAERFRKMFEGE
jgi:two-component system LytT family response regulator